MPRNLPPHVERNSVKGHTYLSFRIGKGPRIRMPADPRSEEFRVVYAQAMATYAAPKKDAGPTIDTLIESYLRSSSYKTLADTSKPGYMSRINTMRKDHGHRSLAGLTRSASRKQSLNR
jgi:enterobacteria phage integrase